MQSNKPEPGKAYSLTAMMGGKNKQWKDAEIKPTGLRLGQVVSYGDMANVRQKAVIIEEVGGMYGQRCIFIEGFHKSEVSLQSLNGPGGWEFEDDDDWNQESIDILIKQSAYMLSQIPAQRAAQELSDIASRDSNYAFIHLTALCGCNYKKKVRFTAKSVFVPQPHESGEFMINKEQFLAGKSQFRDSWCISIWSDKAARTMKSEENWQD